MDKKLKIMYILTLSETGGAQRYVSDLTRSLKNNYEILIAAGGNGGYFDSLKKEGIRVLDLKNLTREINPLKDLLAIIEIFRLLKKEKPDIVHLNSSKAGILGSLAAKLSGIKKIIYTAHGFVFLEPMPLFKKILYIFAEKISAFWKNAIICVSEFDREKALENKIAPPWKLITIHNGIDAGSLHFLSKEDSKKFLLKSHKPQSANYKLIGAIANFYPTKGLEYLVKGAEGIIKKERNIFFIIIGEGPQRRFLESEIKKMRLEKNFILRGSLEKAWSYLKAFDLYICSSVKEGFPYSLLEAMAAKLPIISTNVGGIPEMLREYDGILIEPKNSKAITDAINIYLEQGLKKGSAAAARNLSSELGLEKMIRQTKKFY